ncbi:14351_t:CDS:2, partial [Racocetra persica]
NEEEKLYEELITWIGLFEAHVRSWANLYFKGRGFIKNQYDEWCWEWRVSQYEEDFEQTSPIFETKSNLSASIKKLIVQSCLCDVSHHDVLSRSIRFQISKWYSPSRSNIQGFQNTSFLLKVEKFEDQDTQARMFFLDGDPVKELFSIPDEIEVKEINETKNRKIDVFFRSNYFMINHPKKYEVYYKEKKFYSLVPEQKRYTVLNYDKPDNVKIYKIEKCLRKAIETIIKSE